MKKLITAFAVSIALPAAAFAQAAQAPAKMSCCDDKDMAQCHEAMKAGMMDNSRMDHSKMVRSSTAPSSSQKQPASKPPADQHQNHQH